MNDLENIIDVLVDISTNKLRFKSLDEKTVFKIFKENYLNIIEKEIFRINLNLIENEKNSENETLLLSKVLFLSKEILEKNFIEFIKDCSFNDKEAIFLNQALNNDSQNKNILNLLQKLIANQSIEILKEYRESPQARKDIKNSISNNNISSSILNPFLCLLNDKNAPSLRMELWQKFEMYFESGWGFDDLIKNSTNSPTAFKMQEIIKEINKEKITELSTDSDYGRELLSLLSERISELGVPILIKMKKDIINGANIPVAEILENKEKYKHSFKSKNIMNSGFVDWAIPDFNNNKHLHCSLATSDETCSIENSQAFRYEYALRKLSETNKIYNKIILSFYSTSTFYDEFSEDFNHKEIGKDFLERYNILSEERKKLNVVPFFAMSHKISSNLKTGIYSPSQLMSYSFKILGAKSIIENKDYNIEEIYIDLIENILNIFKKDNLDTYYTDGKSLNMLNQLYNLLITSKDEFYNNELILNFITNDDVVKTLNNILKKIPENQNNNKQINKNDFNTLIQSIKYIKACPDDFKQEQEEKRIDFLKEEEKLKEMRELTKSLIYLNDLIESIENKNKEIDSYEEINEFINKNDENKKLFLQNILIDFYKSKRDGRTPYECFFKQNKTINNYNYASYPFTAPTYYKHKRMFADWEKSKNSFLYEWKFSPDSIDLNETNITKMCHFYIKDVTSLNYHEFSFTKFKLPNNGHYSTNRFNLYVDLLNENNKNIKLEEQKKIIEERDNIMLEVDGVIKILNISFNREDINFVIKKLFNEEDSKIQDLLNKVKYKEKCNIN